MSSIPNGRVGPSGKQLAEHALWFWSYRANISDHSKKALNATVQAQHLRVRGQATSQNTRAWCRLTWCCGDNQDIRCAIPCLRSRKRLARHCFGVCPVHLRTARPKLLGSLYPSIRAISDRFRSSFTRSWAALCRLDRSSIWEKVVPCCVSRRWSDLGLMLTALATLCKLGQVVRDAHRTVRSIVRKLVKVLRWIKLTPFGVWKVAPSIAESSAAVWSEHAMVHNGNKWREMTKMRHRKLFMVASIDLMLQVAKCFLGERWTRFQHAGRPT